jgi:hypothetical protein
MVESFNRPESDSSESEADSDSDSDSDRPEISSAYRFALGATDGLGRGDGGRLSYFFWVLAMEER